MYDDVDELKLAVTAVADTETAATPRNTTSQLDSVRTKVGAV